MTQPTDTFARDCGIRLESLCGCDMCRLSSYREAELIAKLQTADLEVWRLYKLSNLAKRHIGRYQMALCALSAVVIYLAGKAAGVIK